MRPGLAIMAQKQLAAWRAYAQNWDVYADDEHVRCAECHQSITRLADRNGARYEYSADDQWALLVAHLRQNHPDVERDVYGNDSGNAQENGTAHGSNSGIPVHINPPPSRGLSD